MYHGNHGGGRGGSRGGRQDSRAYSNSSGSSNGQHNPNRPTLKRASIPPTSQILQPLQAPQTEGLSVTPTQQQSYVDSNGHTINETYIEKSSTSSNSPTKKPPVMIPPRLPAQASPRRGNPHQRYNPGGQRNAPRPILKDGAQHWAYNQEEKIKIFDIPKTYWTKEVFESMSFFGTVFRIEMESGVHSNNAYVVFRLVYSSIMHAISNLILADLPQPRLFRIRTYGWVLQSYDLRHANHCLLQSPAPSIQQNATTNTTSFPQDQLNLVVGLRTKL